MSRTTAIRRTPSEWAVIIKRFSMSGLSRREFCERQGISIHTFNSALERRGEHLVPRSDSRVPACRESGGFVEVTLAPVEPSPVVEHRVAESPDRYAGSELVVELPLGVVLRFRGLK